MSGHVYQPDVVGHATIFDPLLIAVDEHEASLVPYFEGLEHMQWWLDAVTIVSQRSPLFIYMPGLHETGHGYLSEVEVRLAVQCLRAWSRLSFDLN